MALLDFILNLAALLLWLNWLSIHSDPLARASAASLIGTLKKADSSGPRRWKSLVGLVLLLGFRAVIYWQLSPTVHWSPTLSLGVIVLSFRGDFFTHVLLFSVMSFLFALATFYFWLVLLSVVNTSVPDKDPLQKLVRLHFRWLERWPAPIKLLLPFLFGALFWVSFHPLLAFLDITPGIKSTAQLFRQSAIIGLAAYLAWKFLVVGVLLLHLLNSYVYLGNHSFWNFINATARNMLFLLRWLPLRLGKMDFVPVIGIALVFLVCETFSRLTVWLPPRFYHLLPF
ncbi:MAG TPA: hypothetical protein VH413_02505 [Verrucomicrobiae bacterium]|jgi:uncharacterized protein YggT (Ycf19 family)|nr:hypothetical protein [Verrucomicrobiae bacterium]